MLLTHVHIHGSRAWPIAAFSQRSRSADSSTSFQFSTVCDSKDGKMALMSTGSQGTEGLASPLTGNKCTIFRKVIFKTLDAGQ